MTRRIGLSSAVVLALATALAGCSPVPNGPSAVTLRGPEGVEPLPVMLDDAAGLVSSVAAGSRDDTIVPPAITRIDDDTVALSWLGGMCDDRAQVRVVAHDLTISLGVRTAERI